MDVRIGSDGDKSCILTVTGQLSKESVSVEPIFYFKDLTKSPRAIRLDSIQFALREKMAFDLYWLTETKHKILMPIESRGYFDFERVMPYHSPEGAIGIGFKAMRINEDNMSFWLMLDLSKQ
jgi:hypothetical protein